LRGLREPVPEMWTAQVVAAARPAQPIHLPHSRPEHVQTSRAGDTKSPPRSPLQATQSP
jgi:hypothetical protein